MGLKGQYEVNKEKLLSDKKICLANRKLFKEILEEIEYKLPKINNLPNLDESSYKTLLCYIPRLRNTNTWFKNKNWKQLTEKDIKRVYDGLCDQKLKGSKGKIITGKRDYLNTIFKGLPFKLAGKYDIVKKVTKFEKNNNGDKQVRFFDEETHRKIAGATKTIHQRALCWLAWDVGENIFSLLQLQKKDFIKQVNDYGEKEYLVNLPKEKLKRSRTPRTEILNYNETTELLDILLEDLKPTDYLFNFGHRNALKFLRQSTEKSKTFLKHPLGENIIWKDYRSSMACHLLKKGWTTDEVKSRLGHKPSSPVIDVYVTYLALDRHEPKEKIRNSDIEKLQIELKEFKEKEKLKSVRHETEMDELRNHLGMALGEIMKIKKPQEITDEEYLIIAKEKRLGKGILEIVKMREKGQGR